MSVVLLWLLLVAAVSGQVVELTDENFKEHFYNDDGWIVKFTAPWCGHCKKLSPVFEELADHAHGIMKVGSMDATRNKAIPAKYEVNRYPMIIYRKGDVEGVYDGSRTLDGFLTFMKKATADPVKVIRDFSGLEALYPLTDNVVYVILVNKVNNQLQETEEFINNIHKVARRLHLHASFAQITVEIDSDLYILPYSVETASLAKVEKGRPAQELISSTHSYSVEEVERIVTRTNYPLISRFDNHNFKRLTGLDKILLVLIVNDKSPNAKIMTEAFAEFVESVSTEDRESIIFGDLHGPRWKSFLVRHDIIVPALLVLNTTTDTYHTVNLGSDPYSIKGQTAYLLKGVRDRNLDMKTSKQPGLPEKIVSRVREYYPWSVLICLLPFLLIILIPYVSYPKEVEKIKKQ